MSNITVYPFGSSGKTPGSEGIGRGTFAEAYEISKKYNAVFSWLLEDVDSEGNSVVKMIWHVGNGKFVDAIGANVNALKDGLTITVSEAGTLEVTSVPFTRNSNWNSVDWGTVTGATVNSWNNTVGASITKTVSLVEGENNFIPEELGLSSTNPETTPITSFTFKNSGGVASKAPVVALDFGWLYVDFSQTSIFSSYDNLKSVKRLNLLQTIKRPQTVEELFLKCRSLESVQAGGLVIVEKNKKWFTQDADTNKLREIDFKDLEVRHWYNYANAFISDFAKGCRSLKTLDIRKFDTSHVTSFSGMFADAYDSGAEPLGPQLEKLIIGNFTNKDATTIGTGFLKRTTDAVLICTTTTPPVLKNCVFDNDVAQDEYSPDLDWLAYTEEVESVPTVKCHFSAIYVPTDAVNTYKNNVYVENGTVGNTGWSHYANIIHDIADYDG